MMKRLLVSALVITSLVGCKAKEESKEVATGVKLVESNCTGGRWQECVAIFEKDGTRIKLNTNESFVQSVQKDTVLNVTYIKGNMFIDDFEIPTFSSKGAKQ